MAEKAEKEEAVKRRGTTKVVLGYPLSIFFIVVNEFCERFSYYGMRAVLVLYFTYFLNWDEDLATSIYHTFVALCYLTPILGAIVADSWLGKYKTIIYLSIVYALGQVAMAVSAIADITDTNADGKPDNMTFHVALSMVGLFLIALGTGGIKPCVAAFGGDQFDETQGQQRKTFFSVFYLCINGGSLLSTIITPILRAQECGFNGKQECYPLAFGVPAALMVVALVVFIVGSGMYYKAEPEGNIMLDVCKCIGFAIKNRFRHRSSAYPKKEHWMDWAEEKYDKLLIAQIKMVLKVLFLYMPLPMFWTLFDQKGSRWTLQATTMNADFGAFIIQPDQMQTFNPILILTLVPIMDSIVYPLIKKCGFNFTPLKRMTVGMVLAAIAFVCAALVQLQIDVTLPDFPPSTQAQLKLLNMGNKPVALSVDGENVQLSAYQFNDGGFYKFDRENVTMSIGGPAVAKNVTLELGKRQTLLITSTNIDDFELSTDLVSKPAKGRNSIRFINGMDKRLNISSGDDADFGSLEQFSYSNYTAVKGGRIHFTIKTSDEAMSCNFHRDFGFGSSFIYFIPANFSFDEHCGNHLVEEEYIEPNSVHIALQIPQYFFITAGEVMFSVTGLEFSYSQAPNNMKSVLQAGWLLTVAIGNFIVLIVAELAKFPEQWAEYVLFASLLLVVCVIFSIMAYFYKYIDPAEIEAQFKKKEEKELQKDDVEMMKRDSVKSGHKGNLPQTRM